MLAASGQPDRWAVGKARVVALMPTRRVLSDAVQPLVEGEPERIERVPAPAHLDPAHVVVMRERLAECARWARRGCASRCTTAGASTTTSRFGARDHRRG
jgi:hypothetical protein